MKICDACEKEWEDGFFCDQCSDQVYTEIEEVPNIHWSGDPRDEYVFKDVTHTTGNICFNCCTCRHQEPQKHDNAESGKTTNNSASLPF